AHLARPLDDVEAVHEDPSVLRLEERRDHAQRRRLAGAVRADEAEDLAGRHAEAHVGEDAERAERVAHVLNLDHGVTAGAPASLAAAVSPRSSAAEGASRSSRSSRSSAGGRESVTGAPRIAGMTRSQR